jgi:hypothetical protein
MGGTASMALVFSEAYDDRPRLSLHWLADMREGLPADAPSWWRGAV